ncbi:hypothetical protein QTP88_014730 [Uroleucon formosanum]
MASKNVNEYLEEELVSSDFEDSGSSDWEPYTIHGKILAYDTDDEETNHKIITSSHNNIKRFINEKKKNEETREKNKRRQNRNSGTQYNSVNGKIIEGKTIKEPCSSKCRSNCTKKISKDERNLIFKEYWKLGNLLRQREFKGRHVTRINPKHRYPKQNKLFQERMKYEGPEISKAKKDDLLELCRQNLIPPLYHEFYNSLQFKNLSPEKIPVLTCVIIVAGVRYVHKKIDFSDISHGFTFWIVMAPRRNRLSGAEYKKIAKLKEFNLN